MQRPHFVIDESYQLDVHEERLWHGNEVIELNHKAFAVLHELVRLAGQLVFKDDLLDAVWPDMSVSEGVLTTAIRELRRAFGDQVRTPQFIETVYGRGYRFIAPVTSRDFSIPSLTNEQNVAAPVSPSALFVGRQRELERLVEWYEKAKQGSRQVVFIAGESGIGKTALVDTFVRQIAQKQPLWIGHGQCIEHYGVGEAYLPVLEAMGRLGRGVDGSQVVSILRRYAPSWLTYLPSLSLPDERATRAKTSSGVWPARMVRELAEAIEVLAETRPFVLVLEDLHWSDHTTLEWLNYLSRRRDPARLLVLGTYRPVDAIVEDHPVRKLSIELRRHPQCAELVLDYLSQVDVSVYLMQCLKRDSLPAGLASMLHQRTSGSPLFLTAVVADLKSQGVDDEDLKQNFDIFLQQIPSSVRALIERDIDHLLPDHQALLEVASIDGARFSVSAVAAGVDQLPDEIEAQLTTWARQGRFVRADTMKSWPDGTVSASYRFIHALYHDVISKRVSAGRRVRLHQQIGLRKEAGYGTRAGDIAAELAMHFERGLDLVRALHYVQKAANNALNRSAYQEALQHLSEGLALLHNQSDQSVESRASQEISMLATRSRLLMLTKGMSAPEIEQDLMRASTLSMQLGDMQALSAVTESLWLANLLRAELHKAQTLAEESLRLAQHTQDLIMVSRASESMGETAFFLGRFTQACDHMNRCLAGYHPSQHATSSFWHESASRGVLGLIFIAQVHWIQGYSNQSIAKLDEARALADQLDHPVSRAMVLHVSAIVYLFCRDVEAVWELADELKTLAEDQGFVFQSAWSKFLRGWVCTQQHQYAYGIAQMREGLTASQATGMTLGNPWSFGLIAEAYGQAGDPGRGLSIVEKALSSASKSHECWFEAELYRLKGNLLQENIDRSQQAEKSEAYLRSALDIARNQLAKAWELRAATGLARLWQSQNKRHDAYDLLAPVYEWFTEGFDTADLKDANALLEELKSEITPLTTYSGLQMNR